jgi:pyruvate-formate lyase-activating enzyme
MAKIKIRKSSAGVHLFDRSTGLNILIGEATVAPAEWSGAPRQVSVALTNACDLRCTYCYAPKTPGRVRIDGLVGWLAELDEHGCLGVGFGGGEPTLLREFPDLCHRLANRTQLAITFTSHGHHLDAELCAKLEGALHFVRISMDGVGETYERLRERSFPELLDRIADVAKIAPFGINYVVNGDTVVDLDRAAEIANWTGARELLLLPEQPTATRPGIDPATTEALRDWVYAHKSPVPLVVSQAGAEGLPVCAPIPDEAGLDAYAHIDAQGVLKASSYDKSGVLIEGDGIMAALATLREANGESR